MKNKTPTFIAHQRASDGKIQSVDAHLLGVSRRSKSFAAKIGLDMQGEILGLLHDLGKYSSSFQTYIQSAVGLINPDEDDFVDAGELKFKIDHSSAGAQYIWNAYKHQTGEKNFVAQILALCIASHHSGLIDCISICGEDNFSRRMNKSEEKCHLIEAERSANKKIVENANQMLADEALVERLVAITNQIAQGVQRRGTVFKFHISLLVRYLFSCLIDADRLDTANFESPRQAKHRQDGKYEEWELLINRLNTKLNAFSIENEIDRIRAEVSKHCLDKSEQSPGLFTLTVPTGGGKTLASLRFALHHAKKHEMERIYYVIPYTSIIDQNADVVRNILENSEDSSCKRGSVVLEYHSNLIFEKYKTQWREKLLAENWDAPIIFTTSVQFLECLFSGGTRNARRMHQLARSVIIFDEIQTLPIRTVHMFNNAINFLTQTCGSSVVLCTATQPLLSKVCEEKGSLSIDSSNELIKDTQKVFSELKRVEVINKTKFSGEWSDLEIAELAKETIDVYKSCLVIVNTKPKAKAIYEQCKKSILIENSYHLSTYMCAAHRTSILKKIEDKLKTIEPVLCVSTQLIEAGVDIDFGGVIRSLAGLDSIAQAAGRCNRNMRNPTGPLYIVNPEAEKIGMLPDIVAGQDASKRVLREFSDDPDSLGGNLLHPRAIERYFKYYFFDRKDEMSYTVGGRNGEPQDTLLNMLSNNSNACSEYELTHKGNFPPIPLKQAFMHANKKFEVIGAGTQGIIVPYEEEGERIINELCSAFDLKKDYKLLRQAQRYTVNVYPHMIKKLSDDEEIYEAQENSGIYCLRKEFYDDDFGISGDIVKETEFLNS